ncbi:hypothetical protein C2845_PM08G03910 [Panicum miliaceum]|uniref:NADH-cytochrome b5 reductase n=1 Tax=Panicum miliaceum TaxID=4540 RepID=A0A3L6R3D2_PANMI|nr:hypothetical protein C2845_PM08G03910 [Panicum miliaceum]
MAALLLRRLARTHRGHVPLGAAAAAACGGAALFYASSSPTVAHLEKGEEAGEKVVQLGAWLCELKMMFAPGFRIVSNMEPLNPDKWLEFKLQEKAKVSHNSQLFRFSFDPDTKLGLDVASCLITRAPIGAEVEGRRKYVIRPYTPISDPDSKGYFDLLIKVYPDGKMSQYFASLKPGDVVEVKGPIEKLRYSPNMKKQIGMIAGGTGITPMLQVVRAILKNPDDKTQVSLIYANVSPDDILLKRELDRLASSYPNFKVFYTVDKPSTDWRGGVGFVSKDMVLKGLPGPGEDSLILVCGPPGMMNHISGDKAKDRSQGEVSGLLKDLGYTAEMVYKF